MREHLQLSEESSQQCESISDVPRSPRSNARASPAFRGVLAIQREHLQRSEEPSLHSESISSVPRSPRYTARTSPKKREINLQYFIKGSCFMFVFYGELALWLRPTRLNTFKKELLPTKPYSRQQSLCELKPPYLITVTEMFLVCSLSPLSLQT